MIAVPGLRADLVPIYGAVAAVLVAASAVTAILGRRVASEGGRAAVADLAARVRAWWGMCLVIVVAFLAGRTGVVLLFALVSLLALREFVTLAPARRADHRLLVWIFFGITPLHYALVAAGALEVYGLAIPLLAFLFVPTCGALAGDTERFLERAATLQWGLMACVYCVSHAAAVAGLEVRGCRAGGLGLLAFLLVVVEMGDVLQYIFGKLFGRRPIAPRLSPNKTWEGFAGGLGGTALVGACLRSLTPFTAPQAALLSLAMSLLGFAGGLVMSAVKRDRGLKDFGNLIPGHGGVLDRVDSLCFAAPVFFHVTRWFVT